MAKLKGKAFWLDMLARQRQWIEDHGGCLSGYIAHYGDPGIPPLDASGNYQIIAIPVHQCHLFDGRLTPVEPDKNLTSVSGMPGINVNHYYASHYGDGGTAIYNADMAALRRLEAKVL